MYSGKIAVPPGGGGIVKRGNKLNELIKNGKVFEHKILKNTQS
jgi:hypothetical protein